LAVASPLASSHAFAANWTTSAGVDPGLVYTDNYCLEADDERDKWIATLTPNIGLIGSGSRGSLSLFGSFQFSNQDGEDDDCQSDFGSNEAFIPTFIASANTELVQQWLYFDTSAYASQNDANSFRAGGSDGINGSGNTNTTYTLSASPYIQRRLKSVADLLLRYTYEEQYNTDNRVSDADDGTRQSVDLLLNISAELTLGYKLDRKWRVYGTVGEEWNDFNVLGDEDIDGTIWAVGFNYTPSPRTTISVGSGNRFFGNTPTFDFSHRSRRSVITASYSKDLTYSRSLRGDAGLFATEDAFGDEIESVEDELSGISGTPTTNSRSPIVDERGLISYDYAGRRTGLGLSVNYSQQNRLDTREESTFLSVALSANRQLSRVLSVDGSLTWGDVESDEEFGGAGIGEGDSQTWRASLGATRTLTTNLLTAFVYQYTDRDADADFDDYTENRVTVNFKYSF
jgi:hypothetical protein